MNLEHFILTRFNLGRAHDQAWFDRRSIFFRAFTIPSLVAQTSCKFRWVLFLDAATPPPQMALLNEWLQPLADRVIFVQPGNEAEHAAANRSDVPIPKFNIEPFLDAMTDWVLTTRLDNDDALNRRFAERVQDAATQFTRPVWLNFPRGYVWIAAKKHCCRVHLRSNMFISRLAPRNRPGRTRLALDVQHHKAKPVHNLRDSSMWIWVRHELSKSGLHRNLIRKARKQPRVLRRIAPVNFTLLGMGPKTRPPDPSPITVVIPACGLPELTSRCLHHLALFAEVPIEVIYVDNGSPPGTIEQVEQAAYDNGLSLRTFVNPENTGFTEAVNQGIAASPGQHVLVLNNDCFVGPHCLRHLLQDVDSGPRVAACGPLTCDEGQQSLCRPKTRRPRRAGWAHPLKRPGHVTLSDTPIYVQNVGRRLKRHIATNENMLAFFCTLLSKHALAELGPLNTDPSYASGLGVDDEWCRRARAAGWTCRVRYDAFAMHLGRRTFQALELDRNAMQAEAMLAFEATQ